MHATLPDVDPLAIGLLQPLARRWRCSATQVCVSERRSGLEQLQQQWIQSWLPLAAAAAKGSSAFGGAVSVLPYGMRGGGGAVWGNVRRCLLWTCFKSVWYLPSLTPFPIAADRCTETRRAFQRVLGSNFVPTPLSFVLWPQFTAGSRVPLSLSSPIFGDVSLFLTMWAISHRRAICTLN